MRKVYLDTNVLWDPDDIKKLSRRARAGGYRVVVPALVHAERVAQMQRTFGSRFNIAEIEAFLKTHEITIEPFGQREAECASSVLAEAFPTDDDWHEAKRQALVSRTPATTDFFIGAPLVPTQHPFVSGDTGYEFRSLSVRRITYEQALALFSEDPS